jgi:hypothetical protein
VLRAIVDAILKNCRVNRRLFVAVCKQFDSSCIVPTMCTALCVALGRDPIIAIRTHPFWQGSVPRRHAGTTLDSANCGVENFVMCARRTICAVQPVNSQAVG